MDEDSDFLGLPGEMDSHPTGQGIVQCLRMLVDEAAELRLGRTLAALRTAIEVCAAECDHTDVTQPRTDTSRLH
jgi:hypothetical protein